MTVTRSATVSLCMIVRDEAHQLNDCLAPVASLFDEIVVVDTGSRDTTKQIATRFTTQVFDFPWCDDFSAARNECLRHARGEWIFWLDADDRLEPADLQRLAQLLAGLGHDRQAFVLDTVCPARFACDGASLVSHVRLFRNHPEMRWTGRVHEQLAPALDELGYALAPSAVRVQHIGYRDAASYQRKLQRDLRLLRMDYAIDPAQPSTLLHLGMAYFHLGRSDQARECFQKLIAAADGPHDYLRQVFGALATMSMHVGQASEAVATLSRAVQLFPGDEHLLYILADCLYELDRFDDAQQALLQIMKSGDRWHYRGGVPSEIKEKLAPRKLGEVLRIKRCYALAEAQLGAVVNQFPDDSISWYFLGRVYLDCRQATRLQAVIERLENCPQGSVFAALLGAMWNLDHCQWLAAESCIDRAISQAPQLPLARVLRAECLVRSGAPVAAQIQSCRDILRLQPGSPDAARLLNLINQAQAAPAVVTPRQLDTSVVVSSGTPSSVSQV